MLTADSSPPSSPASPSSRLLPFSKLLSKALARAPDNELLHLQRRSEEDEALIPLIDQKMEENAKTWASWFSKIVSKDGSILIFEDEEEAVKSLAVALGYWIFQLNYFELRLLLQEFRSDAPVVKDGSLRLRIWAHDVNFLCRRDVVGNKGRGYCPAQVLETITNNESGFTLTLGLILSIAQVACQNVTEPDVDFTNVDISVFGGPEKAIGQIRVPLHDEAREPFEEVKLLMGIREIVVVNNPTIQAAWLDVVNEHEHKLLPFVTNQKYQLASDRGNVWQVPYRWKLERDQEHDDRPFRCYYPSCWFANWEMGCCAKCKVARYCSETHQRLDWPRHRSKCREPGVENFLYEPLLRVPHPRSEPDSIKSESAHPIFSNMVLGAINKFGAMNLGFGDDFEPSSDDDLWSEFGSGAEEKEEGARESEEEEEESEGETEEGEEEGESTEDSKGYEGGSEETDESQGEGI